MGISPTPPTEVPTPNQNSTASVSIVPHKRLSPLDAYEKLTGGREAIIDDLSLMALDKKQEHFLYLLCHPNTVNQALSAIAKTAGLSANSLLDLFAEAARHRSQALGLSRLTNSIPSVLDDIIAKSVDLKVECPECFGVHIEGAPCPKCNGKGQILRTSDLDRQKIVLEMAGLVKKGPQTAININNQVGNSIQSGNFFSKWVKDTDETAYDVVLDGETVENADTRAKD